MFNFSLDKRYIYIIMAIIVLRSIARYLYDPQLLLGLIVSIPAVLVAITFHEFAHAFVADKLGDDTARRQGRLNLNPLSHLDPIGSLLLLFAGFGWGKPVEVNPRNYTRKIPMEKAEALVSIAGPLMNFILAIIFTLIYCATIKYAGISFITSAIGKTILMLISSIISINVGLGVFNLIPLPPLDGSKIIMPFLPYKAKNWFTSNERIFYIIFVVIWITGIAGYIITPIINVVANGILHLGTSIFGL